MSIRKPVSVTCLFVVLLVAFSANHAVGQEKKADKNKEAEKQEKLKGKGEGSEKGESEKAPDLDDLSPLKDASKKSDEVEGVKEGYWYINAEKAFADAKKNNKSVLMNFTGSDWCGWCIKLEGEVFSKQAFSKQALKEFVFLKLDFPSDKSKLSKETAEQNEAYKNKFGVAGFPSIYICDSQERPFAKTGYLAGGPEKYLAHVKKFREQLKERNELLALAAVAKGEKKAELLDRALGLMDEGIATGHYEDVIEQIVKLDKDNKFGLRKKYWAAQDLEEQRRILAKVDVICRTLDPEAALTEIESALKDITLPANSRIDALQQKLYVLKELQKDEAADDLLDQMVSIDGLSEDRRNRILVQKAYNYVETKRIEEALVFLDEKSKTYPQSHILVSSKGEILDSLSKHEEAIVEFDRALLLAQDSSEASAEIIGMKAYALVAMEKTDEAIKAFQAFVDSDLHPNYAKADLLIQKAMLLREVDRKDAAELAEKQALELADSEEQKAELQELINQLKEID